MEMIQNWYSEKEKFKMDFQNFIIEISSRKENFANMVWVVFEIFQGSHSADKIQKSTLWANMVFFLHSEIAVLKASFLASPSTAFIVKL